MELSSRTKIRIALPENYDCEALLNYHRWDKTLLAESTTADSLSKGIMLDGRPARLDIRFGGKSAHVQISVDGAKCGSNKARCIGRHLLGLNQPIDVFEQQYRDHPEIGPLVRRQSGVRLPQVAPFEALSRAIMGQQVSVVSAIAIRRRLIETAAIRHSSGIYCFPNPPAILRIGRDNLLGSGFSNAKADTILAVCDKIIEGDIPLDRWWEEVHDGESSDLEIAQKMLGFRGIGPWTVNYTLTRGFDWLDGSLHGDIGMRRGLELLLGLKEKVTEKFAEDWLKRFAPWRGLVTAHLWSLRFSSQHGVQS